jgi:hypothetical protein
VTRLSPRWPARTTIGVVFASVVLLTAALPAEAAGDHQGWLVINHHNLDVGHWQIGIAGNGPQLQIAGDRLEITIPAGSTPDVEHGFINVGMATGCVVRGDYDVQVDYSLVEWPAANGVQVLFGDAPPVNSHSIARGQFPNESYLSFFAPDSVAGAATSDLNSTMRLVRTGATITSFFLSNGVWVPLLSGSTQTGDTPFAIAALSFSPVAEEVKISYSDFEVNAGQVICSA